MQEILLIGAAVLALFFLPRLMAKKPETRVVRTPMRLSVRMRLAVLLSVFWLFGAAVVTRPWEDAPERFLLSGLAPVLAFWGILWVLTGKRRWRR